MFDPDAIKQLSNLELLRMIRNPADYQAIAVQEAQKVWKQRNLTENQRSEVEGILELDVQQHGRQEQ